MKHLFIINPIAGKGKGLKYISKIKKYFSVRNDKYFIEVTKYPGHAIGLVRKYVSQDTYRVYSIGGDGTLNEVLNGMIGSDSSLAIIPAGSGNDFFKSVINHMVKSGSIKVKDKKNVFKSTLLEKLINGSETPIDVGIINDRYFINISSLGFDAEVVYKSNKIKRLPLITGLFAYILSVFVTLINYKANYLEIVVDGQFVGKNSLLVAVANGEYYGGGMNPAPLARIDDGYLDICLIEYVKRLKIIRLFPKFIKGEHTNIKEVSFYRGKNISILSNNKIAINIDGEIDMVSGKIDFKIVPKYINLVLPH
jgi:YegS/Rv2252/BmrU family lipid kinase